jgi:hypothetical protein
MKKGIPLWDQKVNLITGWKPSKVRYKKTYPDSINPGVYIPEIDYPILYEL